MRYSSVPWQDTDRKTDITIFSRMALQVKRNMMRMSADPKTDLRNALTEAIYCPRTERIHSARKRGAKKRDQFLWPMGRGQWGGSIQEHQESPCLCFVRDGEPGTLERRGLLMHSQEDPEPGRLATPEASVLRPRLFHGRAPYCR